MFSPRMAFIFRPATFNMLKPLQQRYANAAFGRFRPHLRLIHKVLLGIGPLSLVPMTAKSIMAEASDHEQPISNQPHHVLQQSIRNQTNFSTTLTAHLLSKKPDSNVVFSPVSIHAVLSLLAQGTKGRTHDQLLEFFNTNSNNSLHSLYSQHVSSIFADSGPIGGPTLSIANGVWIDKTLSFKSSFKQAVDNVYKAACEQVDFRNKAFEVANEVNLWAKKQTNGLIKELLPVNAVKKWTRLIFVNAVYFKGTWSETFDQSMTHESDFHLLDSNRVQVPFMTSYKDQLVCEYDDFKVLGLPYLQGQDKRQFTMYFFLPHAKDGLHSLVEKIGSTSDFIENHVPREEVEVRRFLIPKFKLEFGFEASDMLKELGLELPFRPESGVTEIADSSIGESLSVSKIYHKSVVEVNEEGTEAAAATASMMGSSALNAEIRKKVDFVADHPFMFVIREDVTGTVLFMGQVTNPSVGSNDS